VNQFLIIVAQVQELKTSRIYTVTTISSFYFTKNKFAKKFQGS